MRPSKGIAMEQYDTWEEIEYHFDSSLRLIKFVGEVVGMTPKEIREQSFEIEHLQAKVAELNFELKGVKETLEVANLIANCKPIAPS